ncbi:MAG: hypothetical protein MUF58_23370, partial [Arcicella sp.]|nr:hypothetical protein [Arcicella sp.]
MKKITYLALVGIMLLCPDLFSQKKKVNAPPKIASPTNVVTPSTPAGTTQTTTVLMPPQKVTSVEGV